MCICACACSLSGISVARWREADVLLDNIGPRRDLQQWNLLPQQVCMSCLDLFTAQQGCIQGLLSRGEHYAKNVGHAFLWYVQYITHTSVVTYVACMLIAMHLKKPPPCTVYITSTTCMYTWYNYSRLLSYTLKAVGHDIRPNWY